MAVVLFFTFCGSVLLFGIGFCVLTLRYHHQVDRKAAAERASLSNAATGAPSN